MKIKKLTIHQYELPTVIREEKDGGFTATCPLWSDCYAQGDTVEEVVNEISYVTSSLIELYKEEGLAIPLRLKGTLKKPVTNINLTFPVIVTT